MTVLELEPWVNKKAVADFLGCSSRKVSYLIADGLPSAILDGRRKFRLSEVEAWLERSGRLRRDG